MQELGPLPACPAGETVQQLRRLARVHSDPCRLVRQVKQFEQPGLSQADELLHLPDKPAGVDEKEQRLLAPELLPVPDEPAGV